MLLTFEQAKQSLLQAAQAASVAKPLSRELVLLSQAKGRISSEPIVAPISVPSFDNSAMDGYAVRLSDLAASKTLPIADQLFAGDDIARLNWPVGTCLRIMTGAAVPSEADAVVMQEETQLSEQGVMFTQQVNTGQNIRRTGEDVKAGEIVLPQGRPLSIPTLSTLATLGISQLNVFKPLCVAVFSTGNELTPIGETLVNSGAIYDSNRFTLTLLLQALNCQVIDLGIIPDDPEQIKQTLLSASQQANLIITSGGVSVGDADYTKTALQALGTIHFWKLAIKPGKPFAFGQIGDAFFCGLPGNPVSTLVTFYQLVQPLILALSGRDVSDLQLPSFQVKAASSFKKRAGRLDFQRGILQIAEHGELEVVSSGQQGSHITQSFNKANCFVLLEQDRGNVEKGEFVTVQPFNGLLT